MILALKVLLLIGGPILLIDALASLIYFWDQRLFYQLVRVERLIFAILLIVGGALL